MPYRIAHRIHRRPAKLECPSGINQSVPFREAETERITSDAGIVLMAALLAAIGLIAHRAAPWTDRRNQIRVRLPFKSLLRQRFAQRMAGWMPLRDPVHWRKDPAFLGAVPGKRGAQHHARYRQGLLFTRSDFFSRSY